MVKCVVKCEQCGQVCMCVFASVLCCKYGDKCGQVWSSVSSTVKCGQVKSSVSSVVKHGQVW